MKLLSIIIPIYNPPMDCLEKCIKSIQENSYSNFECIFVMDYFSEEIRNKIISLQDKRFSLLENENKSQAHINRTKGLLASKGDYIAFCDSDDYIDKDFYSSLISQLEGKGDLIWPRYKSVNYLTGEIRSFSVKNKEYTDEFTFEDGYSRTTCLFTRELKEKILPEFQLLDLSSFSNLEDFLQLNIFLKHTDKVILSTNGDSVYNYVQFNSNSLSNMFTKELNLIQLRVLGELILNCAIKKYVETNKIIDDILYIQQFFPRNSNLSVDNIKNLNIFIKNSLEEKRDYFKVIPKVIHYIWLGNKKEPMDFINSWREKNSEYLIIKWDDSYFKNNPFVQKWIKEKNYSFASDYMRLWILYNFGGIYLDTDIEAIKPFPLKMLNQEEFFGYENDNLIVESCCIGSCVQNKIIKKLLDSFEKDRESYGLGTIEVTSTEVKNILPNIITKLLDKENVKIYPNEVLCANHYNERMKERYKQTNNTIIKHYFDGSWLKKDFNLEDFGFK